MSYTDYPRQANVFSNGCNEINSSISEYNELNTIAN